jgi:hypothetical protein
MRHESSRLLFDYWDALRGKRAAPDRSEFEPTELRGILQDMFILSREQSESGVTWHYRLAGTRLSSHAGSDLKGAPFGRWWCEESKSDGLRLADAVAREALGTVGGVEGLSIDESRHGFEILMLPLVHEGRTSGRIVGGFFPSQRLRARPGLAIREIRLLSARMLSQSALPVSGAPVFGMPRADIEALVAKRRHLLLIEGGRRD